MHKFFLMVLALSFVLAAPATPVQAQDEDSPLIAVYAVDHQVWLIRALNGIDGWAYYTEKLTDNISSNPYRYRDLSWSFDGTRLLISPELRIYHLPDRSWTDVTLPDLSYNPTWPHYVIGIPFSFSLDGRHILFTTGEFQLGGSAYMGTTLYKYNYETNDEPDQLDLIHIWDSGSPGSWTSPAQMAYEEDRGWGGSDVSGLEILEETPFGIIHSSADGVKFSNKDIGEEYVYEVALSPDRTRVAAVKDDHISLVDLATQKTTTYTTKFRPDIAALDNQGHLYYVSTKQLRDLAEDLSDTEIANMTWVDLCCEERPTIPINRVTIHQLDLTNGSERVLYQSDSYAISRLMPSPDGNDLYFGVIPNMEEWFEVKKTQALLLGFEGETDYSKPSLYHLDLESSEVELIAANVFKATVNFTYQGE